MKWTRGSLITAAALATVVLAGPIRADDTRQIHWVGSFEQALKEAGARKVPVLVAINNEYDSTTESEKHQANHRMASICYRDREVVKVSRKFVCLVAGDHHRPLDTMDENDTCRVFGKISYRELKSVTRTIRNRCFAGQKDLVSPQHLILDSGGRVIKKYFLEKKPKEFIRILNESLALFQGKTPARTMKDEVAALEKALKSKDDGVRAGAFKKALEFLTEDKDNRKVHQAAARYLKSRKSFLKILDELTAISTAGSEGALALLVPYLKNKSPRMRRCVLDVFARSAPCKTFLKPLEKRVKAEKQEAPLRSLVKVLDKYAGVFKEALPPLNKLASNKQNSIKALATLAAARPDNKAIYKILLARSRKKIDILVRSAAILGLGSMRAKEALPTLQTVRKKEQKNAPLVQVLNATIDILGGAPGSAVDEADMMVLEMEINRIKREVVVSGASDDNPAGLSGGRNGRGGGGRSGRGGAGSDGR